MSGLSFVLLFLVATCGQSEILPIRAEDREAFEQQIDRLVDPQRDPTEPLDPADAALLTSVDVASFHTRGPKNYAFPKMLFYNEYYCLPKYHLDPRNWKKKSCGPCALCPVKHSSFVTITDIASYTPELLADEAHSFQPVGCLTITKVKDGGTSEGIWVKDETGRTLILIFDPPCCPEMTTSADYIGSTIMRMAGYHVPKTCITHVSGTGNPMYDGRRAICTVALDHFKGGWLYGPFKDRTEVRALQLFAAWINNVDQTEQNSGVTINDAGVCKHYVLDYGACLGSFTFRPQMARLGWTKLFSPFEQFSQPLYNAGYRKVPWEAPYQVVSPAVGYFSPCLDPERWQPFYANMAFKQVTDCDRLWAAERIAQFSDEQIESVVGLANYSRPEDHAHVVTTLIARRDLIVQTYLPGQKAPVVHRPEAP